jgi:plastocyanin
MELQFLMHRCSGSLLAALVLGSTLGHAAELRVAIKDHHGKALADAVILATPMDPRIASHFKAQVDVVDQVDKQFVPYVRVIYAGSTVRFPNKDNIQHQVYSFSPAKKFELPLYAGRQVPPVLFDKPGIVVLGCNIHDWMLAYIYVANTPFFAQTTAAGTATLGNLPGGEYTVRIWHPGMEVAEETTLKHVIVAATDVRDLEWQLAVKPMRRIPRVSGESTSGYP